MGRENYGYIKWIETHLSIDAWTIYVPEDLISLLIENMKSDTLISDQPSKFPVGKILKVFLGDHSITKW